MSNVYYAASTLMAPARSRLKGSSRLIPKGSRIPDDVWSDDQIEEMVRTGAVRVETAGDGEAPEAPELGTLKTAPKDGFMEPTAIDTGRKDLAEADAKLAEIAAKQEREAAKAEIGHAPDSDSDEEGKAEEPEEPADTEDPLEGIDYDDDEEFYDDSLDDEDEDEDLIG